MTALARNHFDNSEVDMTTTGSLFETITAIISDLPRDLPEASRYQRLLNNMQNIFPFDAAAVLKLEGSQLRPIAMKGLSDDVLGRRFIITEHPRLSQVIHSKGLVHFEANSDLPDPYDGLIGENNQHPDVHDCMGIPLLINEKPWGLLTLDALEPGTFDQIDKDQLRTFTKLTEAAVKAAVRIDSLEASAAHHRLVSQTLLKSSDSEMIGQSDVMMNLKDELDIVAQSDLSVLVLGETGVGKELVARQVHNMSPRSKGPLVYVNCAALPENIAESELFGHVKGAFSGAVSDRAGKFEIAHEGTLFLDEIGELPLSIQPKLLRALQSGEIQRVGSDKNIQVDVRIVAATNRDLQNEVAEHRFRADLYHRLSVYPVHIPPLRERGKDILLLAGYLLEINQKRLGVEGLRITSDAKQLLTQYDWPGNVRELEHMLSRSALKAIADQGRHNRSIVIDASYLDIHLQNGQPKTNGKEHPLVNEANSNLFSFTPKGNLKDAVDDFQRNYIIHILDQHQGNQAAAARDLGVNRSNFYRLIKRLEL